MRKRLRPQDAGLFVALERERNLVSGICRRERSCDRNRSGGMPTFLYSGSFLSGSITNYYACLLQSNDKSYPEAHTFRAWRFVQLDKLGQWGRSF